MMVVDEATSRGEGTVYGCSNATIRFRRCLGRKASPEGPN